MKGLCRFGHGKIERVPLLGFRPCLNLAITQIVLRGTEHSCWINFTFHNEISTNLTTKRAKSIKNWKKKVESRVKRRRNGDWKIGKLIDLLRIEGTSCVRCKSG